MGKDLQHAPANVTVPAGFTGHWCARCEKPAPGIPEEAGMPAKCPLCKKWTVVWIPPSEPRLDCREPREAFKPERKSVTKEEGKFMFEDLKAKLEAGTAADEEP